MWDWIRYLRSTQPSPRSGRTASGYKQTESEPLTLRLLDQNRQLTDRLLQALDNAQALQRQQAETLDRIVQSKFDLPLVAGPHEIAPKAPIFPPSALSGLLDIDDDSEFLKAADAAFPE